MLDEAGGWGESVPAAEGAARQAALEHGVRSTGGLVLLELARLRDGGLLPRAAGNSGSLSCASKPLGDKSASNSSHSRRLPLSSASSSWGELSH